MKIIVNGEETSLPEDSNIQDLVAELGFTNKRIAIEVNEAIIPKSKHQSYLLKSSDRVEVINCLLYTSPSPRDRTRSRMPSSA